MMKKKILSGILTLSMLVSMGALVPQTVNAADTEPEEIVLEKSTQGNPIAGFDENGELIYAGDPSILVDGDTVYLYVGHDDASQGSSYTMPNYLCYSTQDLKTWQYEGEIMNMTDVSWADNVSAWASQVLKYQDKYYLLYCAERTKENGGSKAVAVAVSDSPTGPFKDQGILIQPEMTEPTTCLLEDGTTVASKYNKGKSFGWEDIDPTGWVATDESGTEHFYMAWGNTTCWMCELAVDDNGKIKVVDQNNDGSITQGWENDIWYQEIASMVTLPSGNGNGNVNYTEAPYLYRRQDESGNYFGPYYLFFATHWREEMGYAMSTEETTENLRKSQWEFQSVIMEPTATSDTNHPAVFDFKGHTYFIYHNGSLPGGMGQRRVICIEELHFNEDGTIPYIQETSTGLTGVTSKILDCDDVPIAHEKYNNTLLDADYPGKNDKQNAMDLEHLYKKVSTDSRAERADMLWEIEEGKSDKANESYVSIESYNKPGLFLTVNSSKKVVMAHDSNSNKAASNGKSEESDNMTFRTLKGFAGYGVTFESVAFPGYYLTSKDGELVVSENPEAKLCTFKIAHEDLVSITVQKTKRTYEVGDKLELSDMRVRALYDDATARNLSSGFGTNASSIDMATAGAKTLTVTYTEKGITKTSNITINVLAKPSENGTDIDSAKDIPKVNTSHTVKNLNVKITKTDEYNTDGSNGAVTVTGIKSGNPTSIVIPDTVTIDDYTFKVTAIESKAFQNKSKLKKIAIGDNVTKIGANAFKGINKKATITVSEERYKAVKKLLKSKTGYKKTMKIKKKK